MRCRSAPRLSALQPPSLLESAAVLPHVPGSPRLGVLRRLRPTQPVQRSMRLSRLAGWRPVCREVVPDGSRVRCDPLGGVGARLYPCGIAMSTPWAFLMASRTAETNRPRSSPPPSGDEHAPLPAHIHQVRAGLALRDVKTTVPRVLLSTSLAGPAPSGSADTSRLCQGRLPPSPASPGSGCPQLHHPATTGQLTKVSHLRTDHQRLTAHVSPAKYFAAFRRISRSSSSSRTFFRKAAFSASSGAGG